MDSEVSKIISSLQNYPDKKYSSKEALLLLDHKQAWVVVKNINNFTKLNAKVAEKLIESGWAGVVVRYKSKFVGFKLDSDAAIKMLDNEQSGVVVRYIDKFSDLNAKVAKKLIESRQARVVVENKDLFDGFKLDSDAALKMIESGQAEVVVENKDLFDGFKLASDAALKMIKREQAGVVVNYIYNFTDLNAEVVVKLMEAGYTEEVFLGIKNSRQSFDIEGILKDRDKNFSFNSYYVYEIVKHPSLIADFCS